MYSRDHHLTQRIDLIKLSAVDLKKPVTRRKDLDLSLLRERCLEHGRVTGADVAKNRCCLVLVQHIVVHLPHIKVLLAYGQQKRNVFFRNHMSFAKKRAFLLPRNYARHVMAKHMPDSIDSIYEFHSLPAS